MKLKNKIISILLIIVSLLSLIFTCPISNAETDISPESKNLTIYSEAAVLIDSKTGKILVGKNENKQMYPASTTKILTAILAIENCSLTDKITASYNAVMSIPVGYSNAAIQPGEELSVQDLLGMFLIHSANEIGLIFAEHISGSVENFATLMNQKAIEIGCTNTHFTNPSGIHDKEHYSTAYDMAIGIKTGFTSQAKNCLIAASSKDGLEFITVSLGAQATEDGRSGRYVDSINLFNYGHSNYKTQEIATQNSTIKEIIIKNGTKDTKTLQLLLKDSISTTVPINFDLNTLESSIELNENISAPIAEGSIVGKINYTIDGINYSSDLIASHNVEESNFLLLIGQIALAIIVLFVLSKLLSPKSNNKKRKKSKKSNRKCDSIYRFQ